MLRKVSHGYDDDGMSNIHYLTPLFSVLGFTGCRTTSKGGNIGVYEGDWGDVKCVKTDKRSHMSGETTEKRAILYNSALGTGEHGSGAA